MNLLKFFILLFFLHLLCIPSLIVYRGTKRHQYKFCFQTKSKVLLVGTLGACTDVGLLKERIH